MLNAYERPLVFFYLSNAVPQLHRRMETAEIEYPPQHIVFTKLLIKFFLVSPRISPP